MGTLNKQVEMDVVIGFTGPGEPQYHERILYLFESDGTAYARFEREVIFDSETIESVKNEIEIFQRQIDAGKE